MNPSLEKAGLVATFVGGISGLWYLLEQSAQLTRRLARSTTASGAALPRPRRSVKVTSLFAAVFGVSFAVFFVLDDKNPSWFIAYVGLGMFGGAACCYSIDDAKARSFLGFLRQVGWALLGAILWGAFAAGTCLYLLPDATRAFVEVVIGYPIGPLSANHFGFPPYIAPLIGAISGIAGGFYSPLGSRYIRLPSMFVQAIAASVGFASFLAISADAFFSEHRPGEALFFLVITIVFMFFPLSFRDLDK
jgi:hypothetical protein